MVRQRMGGKDVCSSAPFSTVRLEHKRITRKTQPALFAKALAENVVDYSSVAAYAKHFLLFHWFLFVKESEVVIHCSRNSTTYILRHLFTKPVAGWKRFRGNFAQDVCYSERDFRL
jgi:hypothetical protein